MNLRGETLNDRSGIAAKDFCGWYVVKHSFAAFHAATLVKFMRMNI